MVLLLLAYFTSLFFSATNGLLFTPPPFQELTSSTIAYITAASSAVPLRRLRKDLACEGGTSTTRRTYNGLTECNAFPRKPIRPTSSYSQPGEEEEEEERPRFENDGITTADFTLDPTSEKSKEIIIDTLRLSSQQYDQIAKLSQLIVQWNDSVNLVSRKDCSPDVVFGRHILPSLALLNLPDFLNNGEQKQVIDVGTGGGFPGLPLAIAYPQHQFMLVDSTGKKLQVVQAIAEELGLSNVQTHHGRVEEMIDYHIQHKRRYHFCLGRSVAPLPKFCSWIHGLLRKEDGKLVYIIGGEIEDSVSSQVLSETPLQELIPSMRSEKRALLFNESSIARFGGEPSRKKTTTKKMGTLVGSKPKPRPEESIKFKKPAKGEWKKKDRSIPRQSGYESFKRFDSIDGQ